MKKSKLKQWYLNYFDWNHDGKVNWWEYFIISVPIISAITSIPNINIIGIKYSHQLI